MRAINFLVLLPVVNPRFVTRMPYAATLVSKALFGAAMGGVFVRIGAPCARQLVGKRPIGRVPECAS